MSGGFKKFLNIIGFGDDDTYEEPQASRASQTRNISQDRRRTANSTARTGGYSSYVRTGNSKPEIKTSSGFSGGSGNDTMRMIVMQPQSLDDVQTVIDSLRAGKPIIVNLESLPNSTAQRLMDYVNGALYALEGNLRQVSRGIFLLAPEGVDVSGNIASSSASNIRKSDRFVR